MTLFEFLSIVLILYATILSTILGIHELSENRRKLGIVVIVQSFSNTISLRIINKGKNPIYVQGISIGFEGYGLAPMNGIFEGRIMTFPLKLSSYDIWEEKLSTNFFCGFIEKKKINISIQDSEGKSYSKYSVYESNDKFGGYTKISRNNGIK